MGNLNMHPLTRERTVFKIGGVNRNNGLRMADYWVWCPSVIQANGKYHMFASRWSKKLPFHPGWVFASEVVRATSIRPEGPYSFVEVVLPARGAEYWDGRCTHNPTIRYHNRRYYLFYTGSTHPFSSILPGDPRLNDTDASYWVAQSNKRIGVAWADSIEGPWHRADSPILHTKPRTFYSYLTSNPAPTILENGKVAMLFKSRCYHGTAPSPMHIGLAEATSPEGSYHVIGDAPLFNKTHLGELEDPFLWHDGKQFRVIAKQMSAQASSNNGELICAHSKDARHWTMNDPATALLRKIQWNDGNVETVAHMERPFALIQNNQVTHLCLGVTDGEYGFRKMTKSWNAVLPVDKDNGAYSE